MRKTAWFSLRVAARYKQLQINAWRSQAICLAAYCSAFADNGGTYTLVPKRHFFRVHLYRRLFSDLCNVCARFSTKIRHYAYA